MPQEPVPDADAADVLSAEAAAIAAGYAFDGAASQVGRLVEQVGR